MQVFKAVRLSIFFTTLFLFTQSAYAEWTKAGGTHSGTFYIDKQEVKKYGVTVTAMIMTDYQITQKNNNGKMYRSDQTMWQFDCSSKKYKHLAVAEYSGAKLMGEKVSGVDLENSLGSRNNWKTPQPSSTAEYFTTTVCKFVGLN